MKISVYTLPAILLLATTFLFSCKKDSSSSGTAKVAVHLTDGPADYDAVYIDIQKVEIHSDAEGWVSINPVVPGIYNLLDFRNGMDTLLCQADIPAGKISQMRLVLGPNNSIVVNGTNHPLATPSAQQSGLKLNIHQDLVAGASYDIWLDFDAGKSIVEKGNGDYSLKPVIRAYTELTNGRIRGFVLPPASEPVVYAIRNTDTFSAIPGIDGRFMFCGLPEGTYSIWVDAAASTGYLDTVFPNIGVSFGVVTDMGIITLIP
jgi:hypothetical protein